MISATVDHIEQVSPDVISLHFRPERPLHYIAGQFIELHLPHEHSDDRGPNRWFTLSSAPHEPLLTITTRLTHTKLSSFKQTIAQLRAGDSIRFASPLGDFVLPKNTDIPLTLVACGIGITPFRSIIEDSLNRHEERNLKLLYADHEHLFESTFSQLKNHYHKLERDQLTAPAILNLGNVTPDHYIYIAGPEEVVEKLVKDLTAFDIKRSQIFTDFFHGYSLVT